MSLVKTCGVGRRSMRTPATKYQLRSQGPPEEDAGTNSESEEEPSMSLAGPSSVGVMTGFFQLCIVLFLAPTVRGEILHQRLNYGTVFINKGEMQSAAEHWRHTFVLDYNQPSLEFNLSYAHTDNLKGLYDLYDRTFKYARETIQRLETLVPEQKSNYNRDRQTLLPFVGKIGKGLFGLATSDDQDVARHVNQLIRNAHSLQQGIKADNLVLQSFISHTDNRLNNIFETIMRNHRFISALTVDFENDQDYFKQLQLLFVSTMIKLSKYLTELENTYNALLQGTISLTQGKLSDSILPINVLSASISNISEHLSKRGYVLSSTDPMFYYKNADFYFFKHDHSLFITIRFPIVHPNMILDLYQIITYPVPINGTSKHASKVANLPQYLGLSKSHGYFIELDSSTIQQCKHFNEGILCSFSLPLIPMQLQKCSTSLYFGNKTLINEHCEYDFILNAVQPAIRQLNDTHFLVSNTSNLNVQCPDKNITIPGCQFCLMTIPCNCTIITISAYIPPRWSYCHHHTVSITTFHHVNLALLQQFFNESSLSMIEAHTTFEIPINVTVPDFQIFQHNFSKFIAKDTTEHLNLKKMAVLSKQNQQIYTNLVDPLLAIPVEADSLFSPIIIFTIVIACFTALSILGFIFLFKKYRKLASG